MHHLFLFPLLNLTVGSDEMTENRDIATKKRKMSTLGVLDMVSDSETESDYDSSDDELIFKPRTLKSSSSSTPSSKSKQTKSLKKSTKQAGAAVADVKLVDEKKANKIFEKWSVAITGVRDGEVMIGTSKGTKDCIIKIHYAPVRVQKRDLDYMRQHRSVWQKYINKLNIVPFFQTMTDSEREAWLFANQTEKELSIGEEDPTVRLQVEQLGSGDLVNKVTPENSSKLMLPNSDSTDGYWKYSEILAMIPITTGNYVNVEQIEKSTRKRHSLYFLKGMWKVAVNFEMPEMVAVKKELISETAYPLFDVAGGRLITSLHQLDGSPSLITAVSITARQSGIDTQGEPYMVIIILLPQIKRINQSITAIRA